MPFSDTAAREAARSRRPLYSAVAITGVICVASFVLSFVALWDLCTQAGQPRVLAWLFPVIIDGTILQATISVVSISTAPGRQGRRDRVFFWFVLTIAALVSVAGNALHAYVTHAPNFSPLIAAVIATIAPVSLLGASHGLTILSRRAPVDRRDEPAAFSVEEGSADFDEVDIPAAGEGPREVHAQPAEDSSEDVRGLTEEADSGLTRQGAGEPGPASKPIVFATDEERVDHALRLHAQGMQVKDIAEVVDRNPSSIYRWIDHARKTRPLVPQARPDSIAVG